MNDILDLIKKNKIIAVIRMEDPKKLLKVTEALMKGGIKLLEITMTVPNAIDLIKKVSQNISSDFIIGAGTVLDTETARAAILAGAEFIVSPYTNYDVITLCKRYNKIVIPGAFTPTEIIKSWEVGADIVKIFPAKYVGPGYFKDIKGPYPQIDIMPTGGVLIDNSIDYINAGACAVSIGGDLLPKKEIEKENYQAIVKRAEKLLSILNKK